MDCHSESGVAAKSPSSPRIRKASEGIGSARLIPWKEVDRIPTWIRFSHARHAFENVECASCHGPIATMDTTRHIEGLEMESCVDCHRTWKASAKCETCHLQEPPSRGVVPRLKELLFGGTRGD